MTVLTSEQLNQLQSILGTLSKNQLIWVSGYIYGLINADLLIQSSNTSIDKLVKSSQCLDKVLLISASQTGNARRIAERLYEDFLKVGASVILFNAGDYNFKKIAESKLLILIISTYGEGEPPEEAIAFYRYLFSKKASSMKNTSFAVFSLGDRSYEQFAKAGKDFDKRLEELGANRLCDRVDVDVDFEYDAQVWRKKVVSLCMSRISTIFSTDQQSNTKKNVLLNSNVVYSKKFPLVARLSSRQKITSCNSIKDVHHLEIDITGSSLCYQPGDALGIWYENDPNLVSECLKLLNLTGCELVEMYGKHMPISNILRTKYELTQNNSVIVKNMAVVSQNKLLLDLIDSQDQLKVFVLKTPIVEMIRQISTKLTPQDLLQVLQPMKPRFYSISSAQSEVGEEIHITVSAIRYEVYGRLRSGGASSYLVDRLKENDKIRIFVESNNNFRLPKNSAIPIIMIGAGTGIAPFRSFIQQRVSEGAVGRNWLFFGNLKFTDDFLYQTEWQYYVKKGFLNKINTAWSRDQKHKIYVQDKLLQNSVELWSWIRDGAHIYVCGDAKRMARDVEEALITITVNHGGMSLEEAHDFWNELRVQHRYQKDVY